MYFYLLIFKICSQNSQVQVVFTEQKRMAWGSGEERRGEMLSSHVDAVDKIYS